MASLALHLKSHCKKPSQTLLITTTSNLTFTHLFSSSSSSDNSPSNKNNKSNNDDETDSEKQYPFSGYFKDIKSKLKQHEEQWQQHSSGFRPFNSTPRDSTNPSKVNSFDEIKKNLSEFRRRSSEFPSSQQQPQPQPNMFQNVRSQNVGNSNSSTGAQNKIGNLSFDAIRESLRQMKGGAGRKDDNMSDTMSLNAYKKSLKMQPTMAGIVGVNKVIGGSPENLPLDVFGKELREKEMKKGEAEVGGNGDNMLNIELAKLYTYDDLGEKLRQLRPEIKGKKGDEANWFSLSELNERVKKLKEIEEKQFNDRIGGSAYGDLRRSLKSLKEGSDKSKTTSMQGIKILPQPGMVSSPKEHLVERYFHPDNMSAEEKLKLKLKTVRDEFKMHESDCGSVRVQIAQLTTEILHLSSVLHKKDKHSRRGLQAKVQQRKKLLKYLRRTDWESYSFVLSKLGLRDNPEYKN